MNKSLFYKLILFVLIQILANMELMAQVERKEKGNLVIENIPEIPNNLNDRLRQYQNVRGAFLADWMPDGESMLFSTRFGETNQFHTISESGGMRKQISYFEEPVSGGAYTSSKIHDGFLFRKDVGGNENYQLFFYHNKSQTSKMLTDGKSRNGMGLWSRKGDKFVFASTRRNQKDYDLYIHRMDDRWEDEMVFEGAGFWMPLDWSPDDSKLLIKNYVSINESYLFILDLETQKLTSLKEGDEQISYGTARWSGNGKSVYFTSDYSREVMTLKEYDIESGNFRTISKGIAWEINSIALSPNGETLAFTSNEGGVTKLYLLDVGLNKMVQVSTLPVGLAGGLEWNKDNVRLAMTINTSSSPSDIYVLDTRSLAIKQWTFSEVGGLDKEKFVTPEIIHFPTFDKVGKKQRIIPAFYYKPKDAIGPYPTVIMIHGGPEGQFRPRFNSTIQFLVNELGVAVLGPNVRGSAGYGKKFLLLDNGFKREDSVKDIGALIDWAINQPELDSDRIAVMGGSYGGYMVLASMIHFSAKLKCGVETVGISNFVTFLENTKSYRRDLRRKEYGDERDPEMRKHLENISPNNHAHKINKPMFIIQGLNDPRVPASEAEQMLEAIRKNGGDSWYLLAKDEGHGFRKKSNRDFYLASVMMFFEKNLIGEQ